MRYRRPIRANVSGVLCFKEVDPTSDSEALNRQFLSQRSYEADPDKALRHNPFLNRATMQQYRGMTSGMDRKISDSQLLTARPDVERGAVVVPRLEDASISSPEESAEAKQLTFIFSEVISMLPE